MGPPPQAGGTFWSIFRKLGGFLGGVAAQPPKRKVSLPGGTLGAGGSPGAPRGSPGAPRGQGVLFLRGRRPRSQAPGKYPPISGLEGIIIR